MDALATDPFAAAFLLAATASGDLDATQTALAPHLRSRVDAALAALTSLRARGREAAVQALIAASAPHASAGLAHAPARARAVVASLAPREVGSAWMRDARAPRPGFRASAALRTTIACTEDDAWRA